MNIPKSKLSIIDKVQGLPTLPNMIHQVLTLVQDEDTSARRLGTLISHDQAISSRLLKVANSAYYGFMREIATVQHAIVILGFKEVKSLTLGISVFNSINENSNTSSFFQEGFWKHSIGCALAGQIICKKVRGADPEIVFTAALLHDIGKLILNNVHRDEYEKVIVKVKTTNESLAEAEETLLGFTHAEIGGLLCNKWKFPLHLVYPIRFHHQPAKADKQYMLMSSIIHLADIVCKRARIGDGGDSTIPSPDSTLSTLLKLTEKDVDAMVEDLSQEEEKVTSFFQAIQ